MKFISEITRIGTNKLSNLQCNKTLLHVKNHHLVQPPRVGISHFIRCGIKCNRFWICIWGKHSRFLQSEFKIHPYQLREGAKSEMPTNKIPVMLKSQHIRWIGRQRKKLFFVLRRRFDNSYQHLDGHRPVKYSIRKVLKAGYDFGLPNVCDLLIAVRLPTILSFWYRSWYPMSSRITTLEVRSVWSWIMRYDRCCKPE